MRNRTVGVALVALLTVAGIIAIPVGFSGVALGVLICLAGISIVILGMLYSQLRAQDKTQIARFKKLQEATLTAIEQAGGGMQGSAQLHRINQAFERSASASDAISTHSFGNADEPVGGNSRVGSSSVRDSEPEGYRELRAGLEAMASSVCSLLTSELARDRAKQTVSEQHSVAREEALRSLVESADTKIETLLNLSSISTEMVNDLQAAAVKIEADFKSLQEGTIATIAANNSEITAVLNGQAEALVGIRAALDEYENDAKVRFDSVYDGSFNDREKFLRTVESYSSQISHGSEQVLDEIRSLDHLLRTNLIDGLNSESSSSSEFETLRDSMKDDRVLLEFVVEEFLKEVNSLKMDVDRLGQTFNSGINDNRNQIEQIQELLFLHPHRNEPGVENVAMERRVVGGGQQIIGDVSLCENKYDDKAEELRDEIILSISNEISASRDAVIERMNNQTTKLNIAMYSETQQVEALIQLLPTIDPRWILPSLGRWALDARAMLHLRQIVLDFKPRRIVELGSGSSTVWLGYLCESIGSTLISVDHEEKFKKRTDELVKAHGLEGVVETIHAPLKSLEIDGEDYSWYDREALNQLDEIDLLLIDGPVGTTNRWARYPALPILWNGLRPGAVVLLDDSGRPDERECVERWVEQYSQLQSFQEGLSRLAPMRLIDE